MMKLKIPNWSVVAALLMAGFAVYLSVRRLFTGSQPIGGTPVNWYAFVQESRKALEGWTATTSQKEKVYKWICGASDYDVLKFRGYYDGYFGPGALVADIADDFYYQIIGTSWKDQALGRLSALGI